MVARNLVQDLKAGSKNLVFALLALEVLLVFFVKKRALMMIEPPGQLLRGEILEIDDGVLVAGEVAQVEERSGAVQQSLVLKLRVLPYALAVKARKQRSRAGSIKTLVVIKNLDDQWFPFYALPGSQRAERWPGFFFWHSLQRP